uniref:Uncharacterized protein n=1 Tax=Anas platyrhynchos platyrhynchos TaxID=8840 RepID=A0A493TRQ5_ANAPP
MPRGRGDLLSIKMSEWERIFLQNLAVPPHSQRRRNIPKESAAFQCVLKYLEGTVVTQQAAGGSAAVEFQLRLSLFDVTYHHFFGRTWRSSARTPRSAPQQRPRVVFNEVGGEHPFLGGLGCRRGVQQGFNLSRLSLRRGGAGERA